MFSIRRYLLVTLLAVAGISMAVTGWWSYRDAVHEVEELFDAQLAQSARVLVATLTTRPLLMEKNPQDTVVFPVWQPANGFGQNGIDDDKRDVAAAGHKYETRLTFQLWEGGGERLLMRSANAPLLPLAPFAPGYSETAMDGEKFQVFSVTHDGLWLQVAQDDYMRGELATEIAIAALLPHLAGIPFMGILIWLLINRGLRPVAALQTAIAGRGAENLAVVDVSPSSVELQPMVDELNQLLLRLSESFERERRFTADAAHELRTPLAVLRIHAENALSASDEASRRAALEMLLRGVDRAARLVEQLLTLARVEPAMGVLREFEKLRLNALVREELAALVPMAAQRGQDIDFSEAGDCDVRGDAALLGVLVRNLVDNALRYSPNDSLVQVSLEKTTRASASGVMESCVVLTVRDEGPGVPPALSSRIFERFFRGESGRGDGAGLGLAIVSRIAELHGGSVSVTPRKEDAGGGFVVVLPLAPAKAGEALAANRGA